MARIEINLLPVGQGAMNLIEVYDEHDRLLHLTLIDCGFDRSRPVRYDSLPDITARCVDYVVEKMKQRFKLDRTLYFDCVLFTHRDSDHWVLFDTLLEKLFETEKTLTCGNLQYLQKCLSDDITEDYFADLTQDLYTYSRTYTFPTGEKEVTIEYQYTTKLYVQESTQLNFDFKDDNQNVSAEFLIRAPNAPSFCRFYDLESQDCVLNVSLRHLPNDTEKVCFMGTIETDNYVTATTYSTPKSIETTLEICISFLKDIMFRLPKFSELLRLEGILDEGFSDKGFLHYTVDTIKKRLNDHTPLKEIVGQFLWGGYVPADQGRRCNKTGVGKLRARSDLLGLWNTLEVYSGKRNYLTSPFCLDIKERLSPEHLKEISIANSEPTSSPAILRNGTSAVSLLINVANDKFQKILFTGDATIHTFCALYESNALANSQNSIWTAPHHGSYTTSKGIYRDKKQNKDTEAFPFFLQEGKPDAIVVEAGYENRHGHPHHTFCEWAAEGLGHMESACAPHYIYYNNNDTRDADFTYDVRNVPLYSGVSSRDGVHAVNILHNFTSSGENKYTHNEIVLDPSARSIPHTKEAVRPQSVPSPRLFFRRS